MLTRDKHERAFLGLTLLDPSAIDRCEIELAGYEWTEPHLGILWTDLCKLRACGKPLADIRVVIDAAKQSGIFDLLGGSAGIGRLAGTDAGVASHERYYVSEMLEFFQRERLAAIAERFVKVASNESSDHARDWIQNEVARVGLAVTASTRALADLAKEAILDQGPKASGVCTGIPELDSLNGGFMPGQMVVLAARPSVGKSALASQWAMQAAMMKRGTLFVSLEMKATDIAARAISQDCGVSFRSIKEGLNERDMSTAMQSVKSFSDLPLRVTDQRGLSIEQMTKLIRSEASRSKLDLVVVDYIGLVKHSSRKPRWEAITDISNQIKTIALSENLTVLALCQLNRDAEGEAPKLSHLRESGAIEQDADMVLLLHRESRQATSADLIVAKNRNGRCGKIGLQFVPSSFRFESSPVFA